MKLSTYIMQIVVIWLFTVIRKQTKNNNNKKEKKMNNNKHTHPKKTQLYVSECQGMQSRDSCKNKLQHDATAYITACSEITL